MPRSTAAAARRSGGRAGDRVGCIMQVTRRNPPVRPSMARG
jgi:hypothetical protein